MCFYVSQPVQAAFERCSKSVRRLQMRCETYFEAVWAGQTEQAVCFESVRAFQVQLEA